MVALFLFSENTPLYSNVQKPNSEPPSPEIHVVKLNSAAKQKNNLTFTSSMGDNFNILATYCYTPPFNAAKRNQVTPSFNFITYI